MEKLTREQIERLKATDAKQYYDYARYFYVQDIEYYKEFFEQDIIRRIEIDKSAKKTHGYIIAGSVGVILFMIMLLVIFGGGDKSKVENSAWDGSVVQCKNYLKDRLRDPDSYESIEWTKPIELKSGGYTVGHKYRSKNGFGGYVIETVMFKLDEKGKVLSMTKME